MFIRAATREINSPYNVVAILGIKKSVGNQIHGIPVIGDIGDFDNLNKWIEKKNNSVQRMIITDHSLTYEMIEKLFVFAKQNGLAIGEVPRITELKNTLSQEF